MCICSKILSFAVFVSSGATTTRSVRVRDRERKKERKRIEAREFSASESVSIEENVKQNRHQCWDAQKNFSMKYAGGGLLRACGWRKRRENMNEMRQEINN